MSDEIPDLTARISMEVVDGYEVTKRSLLKIAVCLEKDYNEMAELAKQFPFPEGSVVAIVVLEAVSGKLIGHPTFVAEGNSPAVLDGLMASTSSVIRKKP